MSHLIAVAGKGGTGKTTTCGMMIDYLCKKNQGPVLAVDADANSNLNEVLGVEVQKTLGTLREEIAQAELQVKSHQECQNKTMLVGNLPTKQLLKKMITIY
jgi:CO dehydrogenase maturation factor